MSSTTASAVRTSGFWAEPVNAITDGVFLAALWAPYEDRCRGRLCTNVAVNGVGSFLLHTLATFRAGLADMIPIMAFILL